ncbi:hypothetical protein [Pseudoalteromonas sp. OOF1S-7]|uniref:hypothetical protein n=1 Tax=Pseudoalteromonas sp. OOF1S-7 TaxID=2917757 RepID=UPI001EF7444B|nr:hypothetical protein [Pseudoalteromonas sp. OOF1S-7]MCG7537390.1 hypothetical protein [Pseudoalteromonas sp. OOF1S-7]
MNIIVRARLKSLSIVILPFFLAACSNKPVAEKSVTQQHANQKITVTGTPVKKSDLPPGPSLAMKLKKSKSASPVQAIMDMQALPKPENLKNCEALLLILAKYNIDFRVSGENKVLLESVHAVYEYEFDDQSCAAAL